MGLFLLNGRHLQRWSLDRLNMCIRITGSQILLQQRAQRCQLQI